MKSEELTNLIRSEIQKVVIGKLKNAKNQNGSDNFDSYLNSEEITENEAELFLFWGGVEPKKEKNKKTFTIKENMDNNIKITTSEIKNFESSFREVLDAIPGGTIVFDKQKNGYSILGIKKPDGIEVLSSGVINMGSNGKITWSYSLLNGLTINAQNIKISNSNKIALEVLYNHYESWQKEWRDKLNYPQSGPTGVQ